MADDDSEMSSLAAALANATANERDKRQRTVVVGNLIRILFATLDPNHEHGSSNDIAEEDVSGTHVTIVGNPERTKLAEQILAEEAGSTNLGGNFSSVGLSRNVTWNKNQPLTVHWVWQVVDDGSGAIQFSTLNLSVLAKEGIAVEFFLNTENSEPLNSELGNILKDTSAEPERIAVCEISKFQWTLEGNTKKAGDDENSIEDIQSFWKLESASLVRTMLAFGDVETEETLLEGTNICLMGQIADRGSEESIDSEGPSLQLRPKSVLSLKSSSIGTLGGTDDEKWRVGMALRSSVKFLDTLINVPHLHLSLTDVSEDSPENRPEGEAVPSFGQDGDSTDKLGDAMRYYLKNYCNGDPNAASKSTKFLSLGQPLESTFGALAASGTSFMSSAKVSMMAAAEKGKEAQLKAKGSMVPATQKIKEAQLKAKDLLTVSAQKTVDGMAVISEKGKEAQLKAKEGMMAATQKSKDGMLAVAEKGKEAQLKAKGSVLAAAQKGKEVRMTRQMQQRSPREEGAGNELTNRISLDFGGSQQPSEDPATEVPTPTNSEEGYKFGDVARGVIGSIREKRELKQQQNGGNSVISSYFKQNAFAGTIFGAGGNQATSTNGEPTENHGGLAKIGDSYRAVVAKGKEAAGRDSKASYKLGDFSRGLVDKTKEAIGKDSSQKYRFGGFSSGLFGTKINRGPEPPTTQAE